ncbi:deoxyribodipyrimidine photo-lyase [Solidesulfovibrio sp.]
MLVHPARVRSLSENAPRRGPVVYWMSREQRAEDNWGLLHAAGLARQDDAPLLVLFALVPTYPGATWRHYDFLLRGLSETEAALRARNIPFFLVPGDPTTTVPQFLARVGAGTCVTDFDPLRLKQHWKGAVSAAFAGALCEVDGHNVVPCLTASPRRDYAAATLRPKIHRRLAEFLEPFPELPAFAAANLDDCDPVDWIDAAGTVRPDPALETVPPVADVPPGPAAARAALDDFVANRLPGYATGRNDPNAGAVSGLSPYFHFGQLAPQRAALNVLAAKGRAPADADAYLEELIIRRELADNYCCYTPDYDRFSALPDWAQKTLAAHADDPRPYLYAQDAFETAATHSALWNAAQRQLVRAGRIHGYMRMYWAKKILEWSASPAEAIRIGLTLNDRYALDGRDPNGVVGVLWSVGGLHDRPWANRAVFGQVRYMNERGCRRKFDVDAYIARHR